MQESTKDLESLLSYYKSKLTPYAYNIIGDSMAAEDLVHEVLNHYFIRTPDHVKQTENYLIRSVVNNAINQKNLLRTRLETYPGNWLPSPVFTEENIYEKADQANILNYSLMVLLENLNAKERAVFILKETYGYPHDEIGSILDITTEHSRQLLKRSKEKLTQHTSIQTFSRSSDQQKTLAQLTEAILTNNLELVKDVLSENVKSFSDGGNKVSAARKILVGPYRVSRFLKAIYGKYMPEYTHINYSMVNHLPAITFSLNGTIFRCILFEVNKEIIHNIYLIVNPDKLEKLNNLRKPVTSFS